MFGYTKGEVCNRSGCKGIIDENEHEGCSCHIHPPCSNCVDDRAYCTGCDWVGKYSDDSEYLTPIQYRKIRISNL